MIVVKVQKKKTETKKICNSLKRQKKIIDENLFWYKLNIIKVYLKWKK